jgi:hypothetical protein
MNIMCIKSNKSIFYVLGQLQNRPSFEFQLCKISPIFWKCPLLKSLVELYFQKTKLPLCLISIHLVYRHTSTGDRPARMNHGNGDWRARNWRAFPERASASSLAPSPAGPAATLAASPSCRTVAGYSAPQWWRGCARRWWRWPYQPPSSLCRNCIRLGCW